MGMILTLTLGLLPACCYLINLKKKSEYLSWVGFAGIFAMVCLMFISAYAHWNDIDMMIEAKHRQILFWLMLLSVFLMVTTDGNRPGRGKVSENGD